MRFALSFGYHRYVRPGRKVPGFFVPSKSNVYPLLYHGEHIPHRESFIEPTTHRDALGMPRLRSHMQFSREDVASVRRWLGHLNECLREQKLGHIEFRDSDLDTFVRTALHRTAGFHQTGTTRMSERPDDGVVTKDLAVHGFEDLFIASTSTLPSSSQANPTLTIVAMAARMAEHLGAEMAAVRA